MEAEADETAPPTEVLTFKLAQGGSQFFATIPHNLRGTWIKRLGAPYNQLRKAYVFNLADIGSVEASLGLKPGESGLHDPKIHYKFVVEGEFRFEGGLPALKKQLEALGFVYHRQTGRFTGSYSGLTKVENLIAK